MAYGAKKMKSALEKTMLLVLGAVSAQAYAQSSSGDSFADTSQMSAAIHPTRLDYSKFDSPEAVSVITQDDIRNGGYLDVSEIFRSVPGFRIVKIGDESRVSYHGTAVRQNRRMRVTINGRNVLIGDGQYVEFDRLPISLEDISRVTITRGPNGAAYGDNAFLCNIDFVTVGRNDPRGTLARVGGGSNSRSKYELSTNEEVAGLNVAASIGGEYNGGYDYQDTNETPRNDGKQVYRGQVTLSKAVTEHSLWEFNASAYDSTNNIGILNQTGTQTNTGQFFELSNKWELGQNSRLDSAISHNHQKETQREYGCLTPTTINAWLTAIQDPALRGQLQGAIFGVAAGLGVPPSNVCFYDDLDIESTRTDAEVEFESRVGDWRYVAGVSGTKVDAESDQYFNGQQQTQRTYRLFGEVSYSTGPLHFSAGGMAQDSDNVDDTQYAARGAVNWTVTPNQSLRYAYSQGFRVPSLVESVTLWHDTFCFRRANEPVTQVDFCQGPPQVITNNAKVVPEHITSNSVGYFGTFVGGAFTVDVKFFHDDIRDPITSNYFFFSPPPRNDLPYTLEGVEMETTARLNSQWMIKAQYSHLNNDAVQSFEQGMQGSDAGSLGIIYHPTLAHSFAVSYYGNSKISENNYSRLDAAYNYTRNLAKAQLSLQLVYQHHITNVDGVGTGGSLGTNEGVFKHTNQFFGYVAVGF